MSESHSDMFDAIEEMHAALTARLIRAEAWIHSIRLAAHAANMRAGMNETESRQMLEFEFKHHWQSLLEEIEKKDPEFAAAVDARTPDDMPW